MSLMYRISRNFCAALFAGLCLTTTGFAQTAAPTAPVQQNEAARPQGFPPVGAADFTTSHPSKEIVDSFLRAQFGFDTNRTWQVQAIRKTMAPGISEVLVLLATRTSPDKIEPLRFLVTADDKYALLGTTVLPFGADPFAGARQALREKADGPYSGVASKNMMFVEFSDLQCPHCKAAEATMEKLRRDYPTARFVYENYPLDNIHKWATKAAEYGVCVAQEDNAKFFAFVGAVFDEQEQVNDQNVAEMMKNAVTKAGADPAKAAACAAGPEAAAKVRASVALAQELGIESTPTLFVNGRAIPLSPNVSYEVLQQIIAYQAKIDGVTLPPQLSGLGK